MRKELFYKALRRRNSGVFGTSLTQKQVDGCEAILDACMAFGADLPQAAYILATAYGETGARMQAVRENMNYSASAIRKHFGPHRRQGKTPEQLARKPELLANTVYGGEWGRKNLGNTQKGDGYAFRGWGIGQWTGRANTIKAGEDLGLDLVSDPSKLEDVNVNARLLVSWMMNGRATGAKLPEFVSEYMKDYRGARRVWGGVDPQKYAALAVSFEAALTEGEYKPAKKAQEPPQPSPEPAQEPQGLLARILGLFARKSA